MALADFESSPLMSAGDFGLWPRLHAYLQARPVPEAEGQDVKKRRKPWPRYEQSISLEVNRLCMEGFDTSFSHTYCVVLLPLVWSLYHILGSTCFPKEMAEKKREVYASAAEKYSPVKVKQ